MAEAKFESIQMYALGGVGRYLMYEIEDRCEKL